LPLSGALTRCCNDFNTDGLGIRGTRASAAAKSARDYSSLPYHSPDKICQFKTASQLLSYNV
jgi:hypothetical protein